MVRRMLCAAPAAGVAAFAVAAVGAALPAFAGMGQPSPGQMGLQVPATPVMAEISTFYDFANIIIVSIAAFVLILMLYVMWRFNESKNPKPSVTTHNTVLEVAWTVVPILILVAIAIPSFKLLHLQYAFPKPDLTIKAIGYTWYWSHEYPDQDGIKFDSYILSDDDRAALEAKGISAPRNLAVDNEVIVPVNKVVHVLVTADPDGVIHSWTIPSFGSKVDAVPGRVTATWFQATHKGIFYGQCSELCGKDHALMPIAVRVVDEPVFTAWADLRKAAAAEKDSKKKKELIRQSKEIIEKAALDDAGARRLAATGSAAN